MKGSKPMNKKRVIIIALIAVVILAMVEIFSYLGSKGHFPLSKSENLKAENTETGNPPASDSFSDSVQNTQEDFQKRNKNLYDKYSGHWVNEENSDLYFDLYTDENNCKCVTYTSFDRNGKIVACHLINVYLNVGYDPLLDETKQYLQIFFGDDPSGWMSFELFDGDDTKIALDDIVYCKE